MEANKVDGVLVPVGGSHVVQGTVLRMVNQDGTSAPWSDCTIVKVTQVAGGSVFDQVVSLVRPYMSQTEHGGWALQVEQFEVSVYRLLDHRFSNFRTVLMSTGEPATTLR